MLTEPKLNKNIEFQLRLKTVEIELSAEKIKPAGRKRIMKKRRNASK